MSKRKQNQCLTGLGELFYVKKTRFFHSDYIKSILNLTPVVVVGGGGRAQIEIYIKERST